MSDHNIDTDRLRCSCGALMCFQCGWRQCLCVKKEETRTWPDACPHRLLAVTGIPGVFECLETDCGEKIVAPELAETLEVFAVD
jgi:hypothetical protein